MPLITGLGNIGDKYDKTRHNIGFEIVKAVADELGITFSSGKGPFIVGKGRYGGEQVILVMPTNYMNNSGIAVAKALNFYDIPPSDCLVCYDDLHLPVGKIRFRPRGSAAGHNGVSDIIEKLGSDNFPRLRFGIGSGFPRGGQSSYVLRPFSPDQQPEVDVAVNIARDGVLHFIREGITSAMNEFN